MHNCSFLYQMAHYSIYRTVFERNHKTGALSVLFSIADSGTAHLSAFHNFNKSIFLRTLLHLILIKLLPWAWQGEMIFSAGYIFTPREHTSARNQCLECSGRAEERQADSRNKSKVATPTLLRQGSDLIYNDQLIWAFSLIQEVLQIGRQLHFSRHSHKAWTILSGHIASKFIIQIAAQIFQP